jgi:hypothetical protein
VTETPSKTKPTAKNPSKKHLQKGTPKSASG